MAKGAVQKRKRPADVSGDSFDGTTAKKRTMTAAGVVENGAAKIVTLKRAIAKANSSDDGSDEETETVARVQLTKPAAPQRNGGAKVKSSNSSSDVDKKSTALTPTSSMLSAEKTKMENGSSMKSNNVFENGVVDTNEGTLPDGDRPENGNSTSKRMGKKAKGTGDGWGGRAAADFRHVQGKNFRHEKTKKKRGAYVGGTIDTGVHSIKFPDDDDDL